MGKLNDLAKATGKMVRDHGGQGREKARKDFSNASPSTLIEQIVTCDKNVIEFEKPLNETQTAQATR